MSDSNKRKREEDPAPAASSESRNAGGEEKRARPASGITGGVYIPPFKLARMQKDIKDKSGADYQRLTWDALRKSINGLINKVNATNIKNIIPEIFRENLIRGRGLFCRSVMKAQMASPNFTHVYAALVAVVNTKLPEVGMLLLTRAILQFRRAFKRNDKIVCIAATKLLSHLVNQKVADELLALQMCFLLLAKPTNDSVEVCCEMLKECGQILSDLSPPGVNAVFERLRGILHEGEIDVRVQYIIEKLFAIRKTNFNEFPGIIPELDLVEGDDQITHQMDLDDESLDSQEMLNVFKVDPEYDTNEETWKSLRAEIIGDDNESSSGSGSDSDSSSEGYSSDEEDDEDE
eukprot:GILI01019114.1.p1 GENE.GILI01019114.1~~GILI01019114.1.p1  ORF type:complete len:348 (-),score=94.89 GILI01019114.1:2-1045(-)